MTINALVASCVIFALRYCGIECATNKAIRVHAKMANTVNTVTATKSHPDHGGNERRFTATGVSIGGSTCSGDCAGACTSSGMGSSGKDMNQWLSPAVTPTLLDA